MKKNQIFIKCGTEYKEMTKELLEACDLAGEIEKKFEKCGLKVLSENSGAGLQQNSEKVITEAKFETKSSLIDNSEAEVDCFCSSDSVEKQNSEFGLYNMRIGIKPNLVAPMEAYWGGTTHPEVVAGIVEYLQEKGFSKLVIMEGSWVGDKTSESYEVCGFKSLCEKYNVPFLDMQKEKGVPVQCGDMTLNICKSVLDLDFLINVPVLKGHCQTKITCALKNMKGLLPNSEKRRFHALGLHDPIAHLGLAIHQDFIVVDNICGDLDFEDGGNPVEMNRVLAAVDPVLMDAYVCDMMYYQPEEVPYITKAAALGVGCADIRQAEIHALDGNPGAPIPKSRKVVELADAVEEVESCSACYGNLIPALDRLKQEGLLSNLTTRISIGQGYRNQKGTLGIGHCTRHFTHHLEGCPPTEEEIYEFLKNYLGR